MSVASAAAPSRAQLALVLGVGVAAASCSAIFIRLAGAASGSSDPGFSLLVAAGRMGLAGLVFLPVGLAALRRERPSGRVLWLVVAAGLCLAVHFACWIGSLSYTSVAASTAIVTTNPLWVSLFAWLFLKERPRPNVVAGALVALAGGVLVGLSDAGGSRALPNPLLGDLLALAGALAVSGYFLLGRAAQASLSLGAYAGLAYPVAGLALLPAPLLAGVPYLGYPWEAYLWIALLALVPQLVGHTAFNWAMRYLEPGLVTTVILLEPVGAALAAALLLGEVPGPLTGVGALLLLGGVLLGSSRRAVP